MKKKKVVTSPANSLTRADYEQWFKNAVMFTAPILVIFFGQLSSGVPLEKASSIALYALYALLADLFKKYKQEI